MRVKELAVLIAIGFCTQANAESCPELYTAVKREAMDCGFFCDQKRLAPLQRTYELNCIVIVVPLEFVSAFENASGEADISWPQVQSPYIIPLNEARFPF